MLLSVLVCRAARSGAAGGRPGARSALVRRALATAAALRAKEEHAYAERSTFRFSELSYTPAWRRPLPSDDELTFGAHFTDHMMVAHWKAGEGWSAPEIVPFGPLAISPACSALHYSIGCFEGMKAYKDERGAIRLFRPEMNIERLQESAARVALPRFDSGELLKCVEELLRVDARWVPRAPRHSLYIRPTFIANNTNLGVSAANRALLYVIASPVGPYYREGFKPVKLLADTRYVRAWPGGTGSHKLAANYAGGILPQREAAREGYAQILWLDGSPEQAVTEAGTMNFFALLRAPDGERELVTAPLDGTVLPGVTRASVLELARAGALGRLRVSERRLPMGELLEALAGGRLLEAFGSGTAAVVCPVRAIAFEGREHEVPLGSARAGPGAAAGELTEAIAARIHEIQYGRVAWSDWSRVVPGTGPEAEALEASWPTPAPPPPPAPAASAL